MTIKPVAARPAQVHTPGGGSAPLPPFGAGGKFKREDNERLDKQYGTDPRSPLHTNNRFPSVHRRTDLTG